LALNFVAVGYFLLRSTRHFWQCLMALVISPVQVLTTVQVWSFGAASVAGFFF
jgi:hypothetical protein